MRISSVRDFRDHATTLMRDDEPLLVTRRGRLAGVFLPWTEATLPVILKRELFLALTADIAKQAAKARVNEDEVGQDFAAWRKKRRAAGR
jgi:PHD/YefM family antitoxin component YafN of YafNO toxin-antitoxin module